MKAGFLLYIALCVVFLTACSDERNYMLDGNITGLVNPVICIETSSDQDMQRDTVLAKAGEFQFTSSADSVEPVIIYMEEDSVWITVWAKNGDTIHIAGNADDPELIEFTGNEINDLLTGFRQDNKAIITERNNSDDTLRKLELDQLLMQKSRDFIREHSSSIASLVLIQDYVIQCEDAAMIGETLSLVKSPAKENQLYKRLEEFYLSIAQ